jgi:hypothetical protein
LRLAARLIKITGWLAVNGGQFLRGAHIGHGATLNEKERSINGSKLISDSLK